jgi:hypothetical protein
MVFGSLLAFNVTPCAMFLQSSFASAIQPEDIERRPPPPPLQGGGFPFPQLQ